MLSIFYAYYIYQNALQTTFIMEANSLSPDQTAPKNIEKIKLCDYSGECSDILWSIKRYQPANFATLQIHFCAHFEQTKASAKLSFWVATLWTPGLEVIKFEYSLKLKISINDWLLADICTQILWPRGLVLEMLPQKLQTL